MTGSASGTIVLVGAGNMGGAMLRGWLSADMSRGDVIVLDPAPSAAMAALIKENGLRHETAAPEGVTADILFLAVKPQLMDKVLPGLAPIVGDRTTAVSIAAGTKLATIEKGLGGPAVVRAMPNTPAMVGRGITAAFASDKVTEAARATVERLLAVSGPVEWIEREELMDAVTAVSGSGPAYVFHLVECMAEAGRKAGLDAGLAMRLARETVAGAGELMHQSDDDAATLRGNVTSPGGTTAAALDVLMDETNGMQPLFDAAIAAAKRRAGELG